MPRELSVAALTVLHAVARGFSHGFDIIDDTGLPGGTVYPALDRLEDLGYARSRWEDEATAHREGRPARRYFEITGRGSRALAEAIERYPLLRAAVRDEGR